MSDFPYVDVVSTTGLYSLENSLGATRDLDWSFRFDGMSLTRTVPLMSVLGAYGARKTGPTTTAAREFSMVGLVQGATPAAASAAADELEAFLSFGPVKVIRNGKYLEAELVNFLREWENERVSEVTIEMVAFMPLWVAYTESSSVEGMSSTVDGLVVSNGGSVFANPTVTVAVTGASAGTYLEITNDTNGDSLRITDSFVSGDVYAINTEGFIVTLNDTRALSVIDDTFLLNGFRLEAGTNTLSFASDATFNGNITIAFRERFFSP